MWISSPAFWEALAAPSRRWATRVEVLSGGEYVDELDVVVSGKVSLDSVAVRRSADVELVDPHGTLTPAKATDLLAPRGTELRLSRGLQLADRTWEYVPLGVLGVADPEVESQSGRTRISLSAHDRVDAVRLRRFVAPYVIGAGTPTHSAISGIITQMLGPSQLQRIERTGATTPALVYEALSDPWDAVRDLARADALVAFFDPVGTFAVTRDVPTRTGVRYEPGPASTFRKVKRSMTSETTYTGVRVSIEHPDLPPVVVLVWDDDPTSPTYYLGPLGPRPYGFSSPAITTEAQAIAVAQTILARVTRMPQEAELETVGHPGHEVGDIVEVVDPATKTSGEWEVTGGSIPLRPGPITWKLREVV